MTVSNSLLQQLTEKLLRLNLTIATAESCTGGLIAGLLTQLPGSSNWFERGFITYSNRAKKEDLQVDPKILQQFGAVSEEVAKAMATGALARSPANLALAVTGIAGPDGGSLAKPVGTVWFGFAWRDRLLRADHYCFTHSTRAEIRKQACNYALQTLLELISSDKSIAK